MSKWSKWFPMPHPEKCRWIGGPDGPGVYQVKNIVTNEYIQFGISIRCQERMQSLYPKPYGKGTRNNTTKRAYILENWGKLEYRTIATETREEAQEIEKILKAKKPFI